MRRVMRGLLPKPLRNGTQEDICQRDSQDIPTITVEKDTGCGCILQELQNN